MFIIPWSSGRLLVWDATCSATFAYSNLSAAVTMAGAVALQAEKLKNKKCSHLISVTLDDNSHQHLLQKISVAVQPEGSFGGGIQDG